MRQYGTVQTQFWTHPKIINLSDKEKLLYLYLITGPHVSPLGCYRMPKAYVEEDLKWKTGELEKVWSKLEGSFFVYDQAYDLILIFDFLEWNPIPNPNAGKARYSEFVQIPQNFKYYQSLIASLEPFQERLGEPLPKDIPKPEQEHKHKQEHEQEHDHGEERVRSTRLKNKQFKEESIEILKFLNFKSGRNYQLVDTHLDSITALLKAGNSADVIRQVIALKTGEWANDPTMEMYLRPKTLFNKTNFNNYVGSLGVSHEVS